jgi:hypothetical protein
MIRYLSNEIPQSNFEYPCVLLPSLFKGVTLVTYHLVSYMLTHMIQRKSVSATLVRLSLSLSLSPSLSRPPFCQGAHPQSISSTPKLFSVPPSLPPPPPPVCLVHIPYPCLDLDTSLRHVVFRNMKMQVRRRATYHPVSYLFTPSRYLFAFDDRGERERERRRNIYRTINSIMARSKEKKGDPLPSPSSPSPPLDGLTVSSSRSCGIAIGSAIASR